MIREVVAISWSASVPRAQSRASSPRVPVVTDLTVESEGARLAVTDVGEGEPIVALHAGVADRRIWERCTDMWVGAGHRVITFDQRGFGDSVTDTEPYDAVDDLTAVMDACGVGSAVLVGNSMGGRLAIDAALGTPQRISALVLIAPAVGGAPPAEPDDSIVEIVGHYEAAEESGDIDEVNRVEAHFWLDGPTRPEGRVSGAARDLFLAMNRRALELDETVGDVVERGPAWDRLHEIDAPTLILVGEYDAGYLMERSKHLADTIPDAALVTIPGSAHLPPLDAPGVLAPLVTDFLAGNR